MRKVREFQLFVSGVKVGDLPASGVFTYQNSTVCYLHNNDTLTLAFTSGNPSTMLLFIFTEQGKIIGLNSDMIGSMPYDYVITGGRCSGGGQYEIFVDNNELLYTFLMTPK
jgi:hypothetical protein